MNCLRSNRLISNCGRSLRIAASRGFGLLCCLMFVPAVLAQQQVPEGKGITSNGEPTTFPGDIPGLIEQAAQAGIEHHYTGAWEYFVGGGVAVFDCNDDRLPDLFLAGGETEASLYINESRAGQTLKFSKLDRFAGAPQTEVTGAYPLDVDNDGHLDLVLLRVGKNRILRGLGECRFDSRYKPFELADSGGWTTAFTAAFEQGRSRPTLVFGNYVDRYAPGSPWGTCADHHLYRPLQISGKPQTTQSGAATPAAPVQLYPHMQALAPGHCALSMLFTDWNRSGRASLRVTNDRHYHRGGEEQLWHFDSGEMPRLYTRSDGWQRLVIWGMGIAAADIDADGFPEFALTSMGDTKLQKLDLDQFEELGSPVYTDIAYELGATAHRPYTGGDIKPSTGWHAEFDDINNDGLLDLFIAKGNVEQMPDFASVDPDNLLLGTHDGGFHEAGQSAGLAIDEVSHKRGRGAAIVDLNMDGQLDVVVVNRNDSVSVFRNQGARFENGTRAAGNWLQIEIRQKGINRNAVGAQLAIKSGNTTRIRNISVGGGHASGAAGFVHVGLGVAERASVRVRWPDGQWSPPYRAFANNFIIIERDAVQASYWYPQQ